MAALGAMLVASVGTAAPRPAAAPKNAPAASDRPRPAGSDSAREKAARAHFDRAERAFNLGRFTDALEAYEAAFEAMPLPAFLFNIAQCHRNLGNHERAIFFYERYLTQEADPPNRRIVEDLIAEERHKKLLAEQEAGEAPVGEPRAPLPAAAPPDITDGSPSALTTATPKEAATGAWTPRWWIWGAVGAVVLGGLTAVMLSPGSSKSPPGYLAPYHQ